MRTVKSLLEELAKFPDDAWCYAYEGEIHGIVVNYPDNRRGHLGVIHCGEGDKEEKPTERYATSASEL